MIVEYIKGSILDAPQKIIGQGVNCQNKMGSGVAKVLLEEYPSVKINYHRFCKVKTTVVVSSTKRLLGTIQPIHLEDQIHDKVYNLFTQNYYGYDGKKYVDYEAVYQCFKKLSRVVDEIAIPKIGCGLAGGNWEVVSRIIDDATGEDLDVYVYSLED